MTAGQRAGVIVRPLLAFIAYWTVAGTVGWWWGLPLLAVLQFLSYGSSSHDYVHRTLALPVAWNEVLLSMTEALCLRSGHAYRWTHLQHHRLFPHADDPETAGAMSSFWKAAACGPGHQIRLFLRAWQQVNRSDRYWMMAEGSIVAGWWSLAGLTWRHHPTVAAYVVFMTVGAWGLPLVTVWWPHRHPGRTVTEQTRVFRGRWLPALSLHHTYHFEHHLYPAVPSVHWRELGRRLDPFLTKAGVRIHRLP